jgi:hypothetical protein
MKEWYMVHNLVDGLPVEAIETLNNLKINNPDVLFGFIGLEGFESRISKLSNTNIGQLLGPQATNQDAQNLQVEELRDLVNGIVSATELSVPDPNPIMPVPVNKLDVNKLPRYWHLAIAGGWKNAHIVVTYLGSHPDPLRGQDISKLFNQHYQYLRAQLLPPGSIMDGLYEYVTGIGSVAPARQVAAFALLAHLFESCDIFENVIQEAEK